MGNTRRTYSAKTPLPLGYAVEWWESDENYHWVRVSDPEDTYSDGHVNHWACWRGAWAHFNTYKAPTHD